MELEVNVLGEPAVKLNEELVSFPYQKVEALFYYLVVKEKVSRVKAASLLWGNMPENKAKKNLRNALYQLKKTVDKALIKTPDRATIAIDRKECDLNLDLNVFLNAEDKKAIEAYDGEFLEDFLINKASEFINWMMEQRNHYNQLYIETLKRYINQLKNKGEFEEAIHHLESLIEVDEFDEAAYRKLMELYSSQGRAAKAIDAYKELETRLDNELGINPDSKTINLLQSIKASIPNQKSSNQRNNNFIGREEELNNLLDNLYRFIEGEETSSYLVFGEAGIGKTTLVNQVLSLVNLQNHLILETDCFQAEERYVFNPWRDILKQLKENVNLDKINISFPWKKIISLLFPSFLTEEEVISEEQFDFESMQSQSAIEALFFLLTEVAKQYKLILVFEDLQWCDDKSLLLLKRLIKEDKNSNILVLATCRNEGKRRIANIFSDLERYEFIKEINLLRLGFREVKEFARKALPEYDFSEELLGKIYEETEGNTFFLVEMLNLLEEKGKEEALSNLLTTDKSKNILRNRLLSVSKEAQKILKLASVCFNKVSYELLAHISGKKDFELIELLEELQNHYLLEEVTEEVNGSPIYRFTHSKLREFIYDQQSFSRVNLLHKRIAQFLEERLEEKAQDRARYPNLIYHYSKAGNKLKHLEYLIKEADIYFHQTHELFPVLSDKKLKKSRVLYFKRKEALRYLSEIEELLEEIARQRGRNTEVQKMEVKFLTMKSRFLICQGSYEIAINYIKKMISQAKEIGDLETVLEGYQELAGLGIQQERLIFIKDKAEKMYKLAREMDKKGKMGVALRFLGVVQLYKRNYEDAEKIFNRALEVFKEAETLGKKYTLSVAAIYNYLGEVKRHKEKFTEAINFYNQGINLCEEQNILRGVGIFYTNAGQVFFKAEENEKARESFERALEIFSQLNIIWGYGAITNSFMALIAIKASNYEGAYDYLKAADSILEQHYKRYWAGILLRAKAEIAHQMRQNEELEKTFRNYLTSKPEEYGQDALQIFKEVGAPYEIELVKRFI